MSSVGRQKVGPNYRITVNFLDKCLTQFSMDEGSLHYIILILTLKLTVINKFSNYFEVFTLLLQKTVTNNF